MIGEKKDQYPRYYAASSINDRSDSSSGAIFGEVANSFIKDGIVYGAAQDENDPLYIFHKKVITESGLYAIKKSKYIRSQISGIYESVKNDLDGGERVLFSGTGCQIAGLYNYLNKDYTNLFTVEVVCHGVPIKDSWGKYINEQERKLGAVIKSIDFRDKREGWKNNCIREVYINGDEVTSLSINHPVHSLYIRGINMEKSCIDCKYQNENRVADLTLADFWNADSRMDDYLYMGVSLVSVNNEKGNELLGLCEKNIVRTEVKKEEAMQSCRHMGKAPYVDPNRDAFEELIKKYEFGFLYRIFSEWEVVLPRNLDILYTASEKDVLQKLAKDTHSVIYFADNEERIRGITTFGDFVKKYANRENWINDNFKRVQLSNNAYDEISGIFDKYEKILRIPVVDNQGRLCFEVRKYKGLNGCDDERKQLLAMSLLKNRDIKFVCVNRPDWIKHYEYSLRQQVRRQNNLTFNKIQDNYEKYKKEFIDIFGEEENLDNYVRELTQIPPVVKVGNRTYHSDCIGKLVNVVAGKRKVVNYKGLNNPQIYVYGRCGAFGYAVEDKDNIPSYLQEICNQNSYDYGVVNSGIWGADTTSVINNLFLDVLENIICKSDVVIMYMYIAARDAELMGFGDYVLDTTKLIHDALKNQKCNFYDRPGHMDSRGYRIVAEYIYRELCKRNLLTKTNCGIVCKNSMAQIGQVDMDKDICEVIANIKKHIPKELDLSGKKVGSIVMNCNPFTKGHLFLIAEASKRVDILIVFVVEENKSYFSFNERFEMVKEGTANIKNVFVVPSGKYVISSVTFPDYFLKEVNKDVVVSSEYDINLFGRYIAPSFGISVRFAGTEPNDNVTSQYNDTMREILPKFGVSFIEIERETNGNEVISASRVRDCLKNHNYNTAKAMLPDSSIKLLTNYGYIKEEI